MLKSIKRGTQLAAVTGLTAAVVVGLAAPASAAKAKNEAFGLRATGLIQAGPFAHAAVPGGPKLDSLASLAVESVASAGVINTAAAAKGAAASVAELSAGITETVAVAASVVRSQCASAGGKLTGSASIIDGVVVAAAPGLPMGAIPLGALATSPAPNTVVAEVPGAAKVVLNRQVAGADGSLTVDAVYIELADAQVIRVSTSKCSGGSGYSSASGDSVVPALPALPELPAVPGVPAVPGAPALPELPTVPGVPALPGVPAIPVHN